MQTSWLLYKRCQRFELKTTDKKKELVVRAGLELGAPGLQPNALKAQACFLLIFPLFISKYRR